MLEGKILPDRQRGQSWRRMPLKGEGRARAMNPMIVDKLWKRLFYIDSGGVQRLKPCDLCDASGTTRVPCYLNSAGCRR